MNGKQMQARVIESARGATAEELLQVVVRFGFSIGDLIEGRSESLGASPLGAPPQKFSRKMLRQRRRNQFFEGDVLAGSQLFRFAENRFRK
jgi:hypothetical protein